jgi:hypothetical protein
MPTRCLSLFGFLDEPEAINYLRRARPAANPPLDDAALKAEWSAARATLGSPPKNFGVPAIQPLAGNAAAYVAALRQQQWVIDALNAPIYANATFNLVEIDPLLTYQFQVIIERSEFHCQQLSQPPTEDELLSLCLPNNPVLNSIKSPY